MEETALASNVLNIQSRTAEERCCSCLFVYERITVPRRKNQHVMKGYVGHWTWTDNLERPVQWKMVILREGCTQK